MAAALCLLAAGCRQDMHDQPRLEPLEGSDFFADGRGSRDPVEGTVARGQLRLDPHLYTGKVGGDPVDAMPYPLTREMLDRGAERYGIFCAPCHDAAGTGEGMVVRRGFPRAASFHIPRLRDAKVGYMYDVITNGFGRMPGYAAQIPVHDRWAIVAYVRALQLSQSAGVDDVPPAERERLERERGSR